MEEEQIAAALAARGYVVDEVTVPIPRDAGTWAVRALPASGALTKSVGGREVSAAVVLRAPSAAALLAQCQVVPVAP